MVLLRRQIVRALARICGIGAAVLAAGCDGGITASPGTPPELLLWVWQRNENLFFIDPARTRLALWIATFRFGEPGIDLQMRRNPVSYPEGTGIVAVFRIESSRMLQAPDIELLAGEIRDFTAPLGTDEIQLDFDAVESQRDAYRRLILALREQLPATRISITALASWCHGDPWIGELPIDAAVPMYYRMGPDGAAIREALQSGRQNPAIICRDNAGYSLDEPGLPPAAVRRVFVFSPEGWNEARYRETRAWLDAGSGN